MSSVTAELARVSGPVALLLVAALVFGETAVFLGFVIPGETAAVLGGVLASRGRVSLPVLIVVVVAAAVTGPLAGHEIGRHLGSRVIAARRMRPVAAGMDRAQAVLRRERGARRPGSRRPGGGGPPGPRRPGPGRPGTPALNLVRERLSAGAGQVRLLRATKSARREDFLPQAASRQRAGTGPMPSMGNQEVAESARVR